MAGRVAQGGEGGSTPVEQLAFMLNWKDYRVSPLNCTLSHTLGLVSVRAYTICARHICSMWQLAQWVTSPAVP